MIDSIKDYAIFSLDRHGIVRSWNLGAAKIKGYEPEEIIDRHFSIFYTSEEAKAGKPDALLAAAERDGRVEDEGWRLRKDGTRFWADVVITALKDSHGELAGFTKVTRDLSERMEAQKQLRDEQVLRARLEVEKAQAEERERLGELFVGVLAHDLRNPLAAVSTGAQLIAQASDDVRISRTTGRILGSVDRMKRMIEHLLDFTRLRMAGAPRLSRQAVDLGSLSADVVEEVETVIGRSIELQKVGDLVGQWDPDALSRVLSNLLTNAALHGSAAGVARLLLDGSDASEVRIETHNMGAIPEALLPTVFEPFRGSTSDRVMGRGLGLGLYITRELVRLLGGTIEVRSQASDGTRFRVTLPRRAIE